MKKKALFMGLPSDMLGWLIYFIGMIVWFMVFSFSFDSVKYDISSQGAYLEDKTILVNILETNIEEDWVISDEIINVIAGNNKDRLQTEIDKILQSVYGRGDEVCWALWYYEGSSQETLAYTECDKKQKLFDQEIVIPDSEKAVRVRFAVLGYK